MKFSSGQWFMSQFRLFHYWEQFMLIRAKKQFWKQTRGSDALERLQRLGEQLNWRKKTRDIRTQEMQGPAG